MTARAPRFLLNATLLTITVWGLVQARGPLILMSLAALLAFILTPGVKFLRRLRIPEGIALLIAALLIVLPLVLLGYAALMQGESLVHDFPSILQFTKKQLSDLGQSSIGQRLHLAQQINLNSLFERLGREAGAGLGIFLSSLKAILEASGNLLLIMVFAILMVSSRQHLRRSAERMAGPHRLVDSIISLIQKFLLVRLAIAVLIGVVDYIILKIFGIRYTLLAASFLGAMTFVPAVGFILGALPPVALAIAGGFSPVKIGAMLGCLGGVSAVEAHLLSPKLLGRHLNLNLFATFVGLYLGEQLWGGFGMLLSVPIFGILRIVLSSSPSPSLQNIGNLMAETETRTTKPREVRAA